MASQRTVSGVLHKSLADAISAKLLGGLPEGLANICGERQSSVEDGGMILDISDVKDLYKVPRACPGGSIFKQKNDDDAIDSLLFD